MHDMCLDWTAIMGRSFARMDEAAAASCDNAGSAPATVASCRCEMQTTKCDHVGSTAVVAVVEPTRIIVANCGDSRAVLCRDGVAVPLSSDHKVSLGFQKIPLSAQLIPTALFTVFGSRTGRTS